MLVFDETGPPGCSKRVGSVRIAGVGELVGREVELRRMADAIARAAEGLGSAVFLSGEPGIGKTHLAREAVTWRRHAAS